MQVVGAFTGFPDEALAFYEGLVADNTKAYWVEHKPVYEASVRAPFLALLEEIAPEFGLDDLARHVFRPYRDVRFSRDKSPYKTNIGAAFPTGGAGVLYVQLSAEGLMVAAGCHESASDQVERLRAAVDDDRSGPALAQVVERLEAAGYEIGGEQLKTSPRGYAKDHPRLRLLRHRTLTGHLTAPPDDTLAGRGAVDLVRDGWHGLAPLNAWLDEHVGPSRLPAPRRR